MNQESFSTESLKEWKQYASKSKLYVIVTTLEIVDIEFLISRYGKQIMSVVHSTSCLMSFRHIQFKDYVSRYYRNLLPFREIV